MAKKQKLVDASANVGRALLAQCLEAPDDTAPLLVYADWLEERGHPFAEVIRLQCKGASADRVIQEHHDAWLGPIEAWVREEPFERDILRRIYGKTGTYVQKATQQALLAALAVFGCRETMLRGQSMRLATCETLAWTAQLWWWDCQLDDDGCAALAASPHVARLRSLTLEKIRCSNAGITHLARSPHLARLRHFGVPAPVHLGFYETAPVLDVVAAHPIESLDLGGVNKIDVAALAGAPAVARLRRLEITTSDVGALSHSTQLVALEHLRVDTFRRLDDADFAGFLDNPVFGRLQSIDLSLSNGLAPRLIERFRERFGARFKYRATTP